MAAAGLALLVLLSTAVLADRTDDGERIWKTKAGCPNCHGWAGDGFPAAFHNEGKAPSLRDTQLSRDQIRETIQCGRPGTSMPNFDRFAYTDKRCYDLTAEDLGDRIPDRSPVTLQTYEIDAVADYVAAKIKGAGAVTRQECLTFFGAGAERCDKYAGR
jgi:hypothetical protein